MINAYRFAQNLKVNNSLAQRFNNSSYRVIENKNAQLWVNKLRQSHLNVTGTNYLEGSVGLKLPEHIQMQYNVLVRNSLGKYPDTAIHLNDPIKHYLSSRNINSDNCSVQVVSGGLSAALSLNFEIQHQNLGQLTLLLAGGPYHFSPTAGMAISTRPGSKFYTTNKECINGFNHTLEQLKEKNITPNSIMLNIPNNPTGKIDLDLLKGTINYCSVTHTPLTIDACYDDFIFNTQIQASYEKLLSKALNQQKFDFIYAKSFSKLLAPDPRAGFLVSNNHSLVSQFKNHITFSQAGITKPAQVALELALHHRKFLIASKKMIIQENKSELEKLVNQTYKLDGGYYLRLPASPKFFQNATALNLAFHPADDFIIKDASQPKDESFARIPLLTGKEHFKAMITDIKQCLN